ncbi:3'-5' exonuclease [Nautilia sp.]
MSLPQKIETLRYATVFNKATRKYAEEKLKKDKTYLLKCLDEDVKENIVFRNYSDYLTSVVLEEEGKIERFKPLKRQKIFSTKEFLKHYISDLNKIPDEFKIQKVGVFDTETTDIYGYIISYAIVIQDMLTKTTEEIYEFLNPEAKISEEAFEVHKIKQEDLQNKPSFSEKKEEILNIFDSLDMVVGHNVLYDFGVLKRELERAHHFPNILNVPIFDTMYYSADVVVLEKKKMPRLEECVAFFFGKQNANYHDALEDVKMTLKVFNRLLEEK